MPVGSPGEANRTGSGAHYRHSSQSHPKQLFFGDDNVLHFDRGCVICQNASNDSLKVGALCCM